MKFGMQKVGDCEYRIEKTARPGMRVPVTIYANETLIAKMETDRTIDQAVNVAHLPGIEKHAVVLPDGHEGYGFPIGGVAATNFDNGVISPGGVGYDINCGVRLFRTNLTVAEVRPKLIDAGQRNVPCSSIGSRKRRRPQSIYTTVRFGTDGRRALGCQQWVRKIYRLGIL